jgi:hypothetical protein
VPVIFGDSDDGVGRVGDSHAAEASRPDVTTMVAASRRKSIVSIWRGNRGATAIPLVAELAISREVTGRLVPAFASDEFRKLLPGSRRHHRRLSDAYRSIGISFGYRLDGLLL